MRLIHISPILVSGARAAKMPSQNTVLYLMTTINYHYTSHVQKYPWIEVELSCVGKYYQE